MWEAASHRGQRAYQEDRLLAIPGKVGLFAVFDGHRGSQASDFAATWFYERFNYHLNQSNDNTQLQLQLMAALSSAVSELEAAFIKESEKHGIVAGTTACVAAVTSHTLVVLNLGDSRAILCGMEPADCVRLTRDHHPYWEDERNRIQEAGGSIHSNGKLFGEFEVSRAIGDRDLKAFGMSAVPELTVYDLRQHWPRPLYLLVGSDGIFEKLRFQGVCEVVGNAIRNGACEGIPSKVIDTALQAGTKDNLTLVAVKLI
ncbi:hypothetical protein SELMODRAFT_137577 [Selaginella moellendorffii]|uniref:PPM-type phosphatase domain-containing protein n=1 Tax=Selaginella moellendorffii TaxID=88036 RepID=D8TDV4_SELML|nr:hypothetical protein SELMODRAFT_137577 [Selaginella moellendorffii]